jgi:hypothetical protein
MNIFLEYECKLLKLNKYFPLNFETNREPYGTKEKTHGTKEKTHGTKDHKANNCQLALYSLRY